MKHIMGNSPKCIDCFYWRNPKPHEKCQHDGWCINKKHLSVGINGKKREHPPEKEARKWMWSCHWWADADYPHINHYEAETWKPDPSRSELEQIVIADAIREAVEAWDRRVKE